MKRFLNKLEQVDVVPFQDDLGNTYQRKFKLNPSETYNPSANELVIGTYDGKAYVLIYRADDDMVSISHDDFLYDFVRLENGDLEGLVEEVSDEIDALDTTDKLVGDDDGVA
jgi:hypothetical protein